MGPGLCQSNIPMVRLDLEVHDANKTPIWLVLVAQLVKNLPAMPESWVQSLGWEDLLEKGTATPCSILAWRFHGLDCPWGPKESDTLSDFHFHWLVLMSGWHTTSFQHREERKSSAP